MSCILFYVLIRAIAFFVCCIQFSVYGNNNETDRLALLDIKSRISDDPIGVMRSWNDTVHFCQWYGVNCGHRHQRVTGLNLVSSKLTGTISPYIGNLSFMQGIYLQNNSFGGTIPPEIGRLQRLEKLLLFNNFIGGEIPSNVSKCSRLINIDVYSNKLVGEIPPELGSLQHLYNLDLSSNNITGSIPSSLGNLSSLSTLVLRRANLGGSIPDSLGRLKNLTFLFLDNNYLSGVTPISIFNLSAITQIDFESNLLEGSLPSDFGTMLPHLQFFSVADNLFSGSIPASLSNSSNLVTFQLALNKFRRPVPSLQRLERLEHLVLSENFLGSDLDFVSSMANLTTFKVFEIYSNNFSGMFPKVLCNFSMLFYLTTGANRITGEIPSCVTNLVNLQVFDVSKNNLFGAIPQSIGRLHSAFTIFLNDNHFSGDIPSSVGNLTQLSVLQLSGNNLQGRIPLTLGNCRNLNSLDLSINHLSGRIPAQVFQLPRLSAALDLSNNSFTGPLSEEVGKLVNLAFLSVSGNLLSGEIPGTLGACIVLDMLYLAGNNFQGVIPTDLSTLKGLQYLDLSHNNLSGKIPNFLQGIQLQQLDLSYNKLEGEVPTSGIFGNATAFSVLGNSGLCGGLHELKLQHCNFSRDNHSRQFGHKNHIKMAILFGTAGFISLVACVLLYTFLYRKKTKKPTDASSDLESSLANLSYQMLHRATNGFSYENLIGSGGSGVVFKGTLDQDVKTVIAIKVFSLEHHGALKSFVAECEALRNIRHRNLIKVITACSSVDYQGNDFKALVYEYMINGSLDDWLHPKMETRRIDSTDNAPRNLSLCQRLEIAVDVAFALDYLHYNSGSSVIHCDLKPSNVLLDEDMIAHVGDFGLAKIISQGSSENQSRSIKVRGSVGYAPPEYGMGNEVSMCGDVYSFGILLLEMFTGKRPTDYIFSEGMSLHNYVKAAVSEQDIRIVDDALLQEMSTNDSNNSQIVLEAVGSVLELALACSAEFPQERPDMSEIPAKLSSIRNKVQGRQTQDRRRTEASR